MNAVYNLSARLKQATKVGKETLAGGGLDNKQFNQYPATQVLSNLFAAPNTTFTPRVLKDGSDSVGALGALNRVYLNIGLASEEWTRHFTPLIGPTQRAGTGDARQDRGSRAGVLVLEGHRGADASRRGVLSREHAARLPQGRARRRELPEGLGGRTRHAARKSSPTGARAAIRARFPIFRRQSIAGNCADGGNGPQYLECWNKYWAHTKTAEFKKAMTAIVKQARFPRGQLPLERTARAGHAARHQCLQSSRHQRNCRKHLGQFFVAELQGAAFGRRGHGVQPGRRHAAAVPDAGRRTRLHEAGVARQRLELGAVPAQ